MVIRRQTTKRAKRPYGKGPPRPHREGEQKDLVKLRAWVQQQKRLEETPTVSGTLAGKRMLDSAK